MPIATVAVTVALGLVASLALRRPEFAARPERRLGVGLAAVAGVVLGLFVELLGAALAGLDTGAGPNHYLMVLPFAVAAAGVGFLAGLAGYWLAARASRSRAAALGAVAGPIIFFWVYMLAASIGA